MKSLTTYMHPLFLTCGFVFCLAAAQSETATAQTVEVKNIDAQTQEGTTIEIKKGVNGNPEKPIPPKWTVEPGSAEIEGEPSATAKDARAAWKKSCEDWKKEFRADNKDNKVLNISCGTPTCGGEAGNKTCTSRANYKIKTRVD